MTAVGHFSLLCFLFFFPGPCIMDGRVNIKWIRLLTSLWFTFILFSGEGTMCLAVFCFFYFVVAPGVNELEG